MKTSALWTHVFLKKKNIRSLARSMGEKFETILRKIANTNSFIILNPKIIERK